MNWEAVLVIGVFALVLGAVLLIPGLIWARRKARQNPGTSAGMAVTNIGFLFVAFVVLVLLVGFTAEFWAAETMFGRWMSTGRGRLIFAALTMLTSWIVEYVLGLAGIRIIALRER